MPETLACGHPAACAETHVGKAVYRRDECLWCAERDRLKAELAATETDLAFAVGRITGEDIAEYKQANERLGAELAEAKASADRLERLCGETFDNMQDTREALRQCIKDLEQANERLGAALSAYITMKLTD